MVLIQSMELRYSVALAGEITLHYNEMGGNTNLDNCFLIENWG